MKTITFFCCLLFLGMSPLLNAQNEPDLNDLLSRLDQNHLGAITDVFTSEELTVLEAHFESNRTDDTNFDTRGPKIRLYGPENVGDDFGFLNTDTPAVFNVIGPSGTADFDGAGAINPGSTQGHVIDNAGNFYEVDIITGQYIPMGTIPAPAGENFVGLEFDPNTGDLMAISTDGTTGQSTLSMINPTNMTATPIGNTGLMLPIALSINGESEILTYDIDDDTCYRINPITGAPTALGPIGFNANFGGGMVFDPNTNKTYMTSYNVGVGDSELREVNTDTGLTLLIGTINPGPTSQIAWGGIVNPIILGVGDISLSGFAFAPNPATNRIDMKANTAIQNVQIYSVLGQRLLNQNIDDLNGTLDVSNLAAGSYLLSVTIDGQQGSYHFIKR